MQKKQQLMLILLIGLLSINISAQTIDTDRPDQSDGVSTVIQGHFQFEEGVTLAEETVMSNFMLRYGLTNSTGIRLEADAGKMGSLSGLQPLTLSVKQRIIQQDGIVPAITAIGYLSFGKLASKDFKVNHLPYALRLAFENVLSNRFTLAYNIGVSNDFDNLDLSLNLGYGITEKLSAFAEYFSTLNKIQDEHNVDVGLLYLIAPNLQVDIAAGHAIFASEDRFYGTIGVAYLLK